MANRATLDNPVDLNDYDLGILVTEPKQKEEVINLIVEYANKIEIPAQKDVEAIVEQYSILKARKIDAYLWISAIIGEVSKKNESKQYIGYIIGIIRNRMTYGWGTSRSDEEILIINNVQCILGAEVSMEGKAQIYKLMGDYGSTKIAFALNEVSIEKLFLEALEEKLKEQEAYIHGM